MMMTNNALILCSCLLVSLLGTVQGSSTTHIVPVAQEETKKRGLLHRHLHDCFVCNSTDAGGRRRHRNLAEAAQAMLKRRGLSESNVADLINNLAMTIRGDATATTTATTAAPAEVGENVPAVVPSTTTTTTTTTEPAPIADISSDEQALALQVAGILQGAMGDLDQVAVYTKHYQATAVNANNDTALVSQDVTGIIYRILDFIVDLIELVIDVIFAIISFIINTIVTILRLIVKVIVAILQFIEDVIQSIIDAIFGVFRSDSAVNVDQEGADKGPLLSFFASASNSDNDNPDETETKPALQAIYETLVQGVESIGMGEVTQMISDNSDLLGGALQLGATTAPLILTQFIGTSTTNSILCLIGATEYVVDGTCPTATNANETSSTLSQESICTVCEAAAELEGTP